MPYRRVFDVVWSGRRNLIMMASQIDRTGNQNISAIGTWARPKAQLVGVRGAPGNTVNHSTSYWVPEPLDPLVRRAGRRGVRRRATPGPRRPARRPPGSTRSGTWSPTSASSTSRPRTTSCGCASVHPGVTVDEVVEATGFALVVPDEVPETRMPTPEELDLLRTVLDPGGPARPEVRGVTRCRAGAPALHTRFCDLVGVRYPIVQTGMGWVAGPRLVAATAEAGGLGILASATMTFASWWTPSPRCGPAPTSRSGSTCAPTWPTSATGSRS